MGMDLVTIFAGAVIPALVISRLALWLTKRWDGRWRLYACNGITAALLVPLAAFGMADDGSPQWGLAAITYLPACAICLISDLLHGGWVPGRPSVTR